MDRPNGLSAGVGSRVRVLVVERGWVWQSVAADSSIKIVVWSACDYSGAVVYMQGLILNCVCVLIACDYCASENLRSPIRSRSQLARWRAVSTCVHIML